jgi:hypothetical protein
MENAMTDIDKIRAQGLKHVISALEKLSNGR